MYRHFAYTFRQKMWPFNVAQTSILLHGNKLHKSCSLGTECAAYICRNQQKERHKMKDWNAERQDESLMLRCAVLRTLRERITAGDESFMRDWNAEKQKIIQRVNEVRDTIIKLCLSNSSTYMLCAWCKTWKVRQTDEKIITLTDEEFEHTRISGISHGCCPSCAKSMLEEFHYPHGEEQRDIGHNYLINPELA